jgi:hypothetical protein
MGAALLAVFCCMVIQLLILGYRDGGMLHFESLFFFMNYLDGRSLWAQVMDPFNNDWSFYQARELSYFFDALDARFTAALLKKQIVWFHSFCSLLLCGGMVFIQHYFTRKFFQKVPGMLVTLISVFFVLSPAVTGLNYFRCAKYLTAFGLWGALFSGYAAFRYGSVKAKVFLVLSLLLMTLSDRQGFFFTAAFAGTGAVLMVYQSKYSAKVFSDRMRFIVLSALGVTCFGIVNNLYLTPFLVHITNGYTPDFAYQRDFQLSFKSLKEGLLFLFANGGNWFSNYSGSVLPAALTGVLLLCGLALELYCRFRRGQRTWIFLTLLWGCALGAMGVCASAMVARHPAIMLKGVIFGTYAINFLTITLFLLTLTVAAGKKRFAAIVTALVAVAICLRIGGEAAGEKYVQEEPLFKGYFSRQHILKETLRDPGFDETKHCIPHRMELFLEFYRKKVLTKQ